MTTSSQAEIQDPNNVQCMICGKWYGQLGNHVRFKHQMTLDSYKELYPNSITIAKSVSDGIANHMSRISTERWKTNQEYRNTTLGALRDSTIDRWANDPQYRIDRIDGVMKGKRRGWRKYTDRNSKEMSLRSGYELRFSIMSDYWNYDWIHEPCKFKDQNGSYYHPDYYFPQFDRYIETKQWRGDKHYEDTIKRLSYVENTYNIRVLILDYDALDYLGAFMIFGYGSRCVPKTFNYILEGSTTILNWSTAKQQEARRILEALLRSRYSLDCMEICRSEGLFNSLITD